VREGENVDERVRAELAELSEAGGGAPAAAPKSTAEVEAEPDDGTRRSKRVCTNAREDAFSPSKEWSQYELKRVDERHGRTHELSYDELIGFVTGLPSIVALLAESHSAHRDVTPAVRALQLALAELIDANEEAVARPEHVEAEQPEEHQQAVSAPISRVAAPRPSTLAGCSTVVQPRVRAGQQLRRTLKQILSLEGAGKLSAARELAELAQTERHQGPEQAKHTAHKLAALAAKRAQQMRTHFFSLGNWRLTQDVLNRFLDTPEVRRLMPGSAPQTRGERADAETADALLASAKRFFGEIMGVDGRRRSESDMNAFWAAVAALMPAELLENRGGRAATRILGVHHRVIKKGVQVRRDLEEHGKGWVYIEYKGHHDRFDMQIINDWWHSDSASTEDNKNKQPIRVYHDGDGRSRRHAPQRGPARAGARPAAATAAPPAAAATPAASTAGAPTPASSLPPTS